MALPRAAAVTLAALHHLMAGRLTFYQDCHRVLLTVRRLVIGDVAAGTAAGLFLDEFVDRYSSQGHDARLLVRDQEIAIVEPSGFRVAEYEATPLLLVVSRWRAAIQFCRRLFQLDLANDEQIWHGVSDHAAIDESGREVRINWQLVFVQADRYDP